MAEDNFKKALKKEGDIHEIKSFNPYRMKDKNSEIFNKGLPFIFFTAPRLNLVDDNLGREGFFLYLRAVKPDLLKSLNFSNAGALSSGKPFMPILSNRFMGISIPDTQTTMKEFHETFYGYKQHLPIGNVNSLAGGEITVDFEENKEIDIIHLIKAWSEYIEGITRGYMYPSDDAKNKRYIDYTSSIYYFLLDFDGETILHYSKYTGCFPINVPYDVFSQNIGEDPEVPHVSINFAYSYKEDMNPDTLVDFNSVSTMATSIANASGTQPIKAKINTVSMGNKLNYDEMYPVDTGNPYVVMGQRKEDKAKPKYRLRFL
ncbi:virion protein [Staphylococcus phage vB_StaM_SA1]|nr:virion protein [Staphylococcus phage vB_StaM_SA1]